MFFGALLRNSSDVHPSLGATSCLNRPKPDWMRAHLCCRRLPALFDGIGSGNTSLSGLCPPTGNCAGMRLHDRCKIRHAEPQYSRKGIVDLDPFTSDADGYLAYGQLRVLHSRRALYGRLSGNIQPVVLQARYSERWINV